MEREGGERYDTVDREDGRVAVGSGGIRRGALVSPSMPRRDAVDAQEADPLISYDINVLPARVYGDVVERPRQIDREVAFHDRARNRQHLPRVERIVAERELEDLWRDCATDGKKRKVRGELPPNRKDEGSSARSPVRFRRSDIAGGDAPEEERKERGERGRRRFFFYVRRSHTHVPFTVSREECVVAPARFDAEHVYSPAWLAATDSIVSTLFFLLVLPMTTSDPWWLPIGVPLNAQDISSG